MACKSLKYSFLMELSLAQMDQSNWIQYVRLVQLDMIGTNIAELSLTQLDQSGLTGPI